MSSLTSVFAANDVFSKIINTTNEDVVDVCVKEVNKTSDESLNTAARLYSMGMCHFCVDCNYEEDNGHIFSINSFDSSALDNVTSDEKYSTAQKLITQAAELGYADAYYSLAVMLYVKDLGQGRQFETIVNENEDGSLRKIKNNRESEENNSNTVGVLLKSVYEKPSSHVFNHQIHKHLLTAAKQGYMPAQFALSEVYFKGIGIKPNVIQAYAWASVAVAQNPPFGSLRRDEKAVNFDNDQIIRAEALAEEYTKQYSNIFDNITN